MRPTSLRGQVLAWLLVPLGVLWVAEGVHSFLTVRAAVNAAYDRSLYASALAISERVTLGGGAPTVDIPSVALEVLDTASQERIFYRVAYRSGGTETFLTGYPDLPHPPVEGDAPVYYDVSFRGDPVRGAVLETTFPTDPPVAVVVQVAETVEGRGSRTRELVLREAASQVALIALAAAILWLGVWRGLLPLTQLGAEVSRRTADDLRPVEGVHVPAEAEPLVGAVNGLLERLRRAIATQRRFIADAAHQLRTPLAVIQTKAELAMRAESPRDVYHALADLHVHSRSTTRLANQLLSLARSDPGHGVEGSRLDLEAVAREATASHVAYAFERGVDLGFDGAGPAFVIGREVLLAEVIANLVHNAVAYGARTVTVSVSRPEPGRVVLAVEDDGPGIPTEERPRVLERFYRRPGASGGGAGLGLPIVAQIAEGHGATLHLLDGPGGRGLRVELRLPEAPAPASRSPA